MSDKSFNLYRLTHPETISDAEIDETLRFVKENDKQAYRDFLEFQKTELEKTLRGLRGEDRLKAALQWQNLNSVSCKKQFLKQYFYIRPEDLRFFPSESFLRQD